MPTDADDLHHAQTCAVMYTEWSDAGRLARMVLRMAAERKDFTRITVKAGNKAFDRIAELEALNRSLAERVAAQAALLGRRAEA